MEIRGWKKPSVQGTQEKSRKTGRYSLNVASTVGTFQPRISNPWLLLLCRERQPVIFKFQEGDIVSLRENYTETLPAGSHGSVFSLYTTTPPAYEINFVDIKGGEVGVVIYEDELECCLDSSCHYAGEMN